MNVAINIDRQKEPHAVSKYLMGQNLEVYAVAQEGLLTNRFKNPKFLGPAHPTCGIAKDWSGEGELIPGMGISTDTAQMVKTSLIQRNIPVYAGEELEVELWAKVRHAPTEVTLSLRPAIKRHPSLSEAKIVINTAYFSCYKTTFKLSEDVPDSVFTLSTQEKGGDLIIDQIHMRPKNSGDIDHSVLEALASLDISSLRFPGGCQTTVYQWQKGLGPRHKRPITCNPQFHGQVGYEFAINEYLEFCLNYNITPQLVVGIGKDGPDDAKAQAEYCRNFFEDRGIQPPEILFQIGNEQFAAHSTAHMTGAMYVDAVKLFVPLIRETYPNCEIIAIGYPYSGASAFHERNNWRTLVLDETAELIDYISNHYYKAQWRETYEEQQKNAADSVRKIRDDLMKMIADINERNLRTKLAITEWNYWLYADSADDYYREPMDPNHCLYVAAMLQMFCELGNYVKISNYYHLINGLSIFTKENNQLRETPLASVFRFYTPAIPGDFIPVSCDSPLFIEESPTIQPICLKTNDSMYLFIINFSVTETAELSLPAIFNKMTGEALIFMNGDKGKEVFPETVEINAKKPALPPCSITRFIVHNDELEN